MIPEEKLRELAVATRVDHGVKKFTGHLLFKLLLYSVIHSNKVSQRVIEAFYNSLPFQFLMKLGPHERTRHSSISERLAQVKVDFFRQLFEYVSQELAEQHGLRDEKGYVINRFDSTIVSLSSKLLHFGMSNDGKRKTGGNQLHQVKFTVGFDGSTLTDAHFHVAQNYLNENLALSEAILARKRDDQTIAVFDRGLRGRETFALLTAENVQFVTRIDAFPVHEQIVERPVPAQSASTDTLDILEDSEVYLFSSNKKVKTPLRMIVAQKKSDGKPLCFLTNLFDLPCDEVTQIYKKRWEIEVFFKFLKQELNFSHFISRTQNGIQVLFYVTLIAAMLILIYRKINHLKGFKLVKLQFVQDLENSLIRDIVLLCGGDPRKLDFLPLRR